MRGSRSLGGYGGAVAVVPVKWMWCKQTLVGTTGIYLGILGIPPRGMTAE